MLYDNAQILELLSLAHTDAPDPLYAERAEDTVSWKVRDIAAQTVSGRRAFAASEDAESEGEEGRLFVWTAAEVDAVLGPDAPMFRRAYDATDSGNSEGRTVLRRVIPHCNALDEVRLASARGSVPARGGNSNDVRV